jgi:putative tryptophan/tyrosine transport system substrate-binding protein
VKRRDIVIGLAATAIWPPAARAARRPVVGFLASGSPSSTDKIIKGFSTGLKDGGYVDGQNVTVEYRWAESKFDRLPDLAAALVREGVDVIVAAQGNVTAEAVQAATSTIPVVFDTSDDPVATGLVASLNRPGGNLTGVARLGTEVSAKSLELLTKLLPSVSVIGVLVDPTMKTNKARVEAIQNAAPPLGKTIRVLNASSVAEVDGAFDTATAERIGALLVPFSPFFNGHRDQVVAQAAHHRVPALYPVREFVDAGGLMSYGDDTAASYGIAGNLTARILKGEKPAELPVQEATKLELIINLKTAKALGLTVPPNLLALADQVIE